MTNFQSVAGGTMWVAVAALLMLVAFEPVSIEKKPNSLPATAKAASVAPAAA